MAEPAKSPPNPADLARHTRIKEVFLAVQSLAGAQQREALVRECGGDPALRREVEALLAHHRKESILAERTPIEAKGRIAQLTFARGASAQWNEEQRQFLHQRIRSFAVIMLLMVGVLMLRSFGFFGIWPKLAFMPAVGMFAGCFGLLGLAIAILILRAPSTQLLRRIEFLLLLAASVEVFSWNYAWLSKGITLASPPSPFLHDLLRGVFWIISPDGTTHFQVGHSLISFPVTNNWSLMSGLYMIMIPNTLQRGLRKLAMLVLSSVLTYLVAALHNPSLRPIALPNVLSCVFMVGTFSLMGLYISLQFQALRRAVFDAKQVGQYRLTQLLGRGAMGEVYLAQHRLLRRPCAVKLIRAEQAGSQDWLERFEREVQAMAQLTHPNTVEVYDFGRTEDSSFFYAMEYLPGITLDALVRSHGPLPPGRVIYLLLQVCGALGEAHKKGLIHRDIKPGNIFVCERGGAYDVIKLLDFGLVHVQTQDPARGHSGSHPPILAPALGEDRPRAAGDPHLTHAGQLLGTPAYMAPEQVGGQQPDARSDIYSLGGVACFLLTGRPPFECETLEELFAAHQTAPLPSLRDRIPAIPQALEALILRCLQKAPADRFQKVSDFAAALAVLPAASDWDGAQAEAWWRAQTASPPPVDAFATSDALAKTLASL